MNNPIISEELSNRILMVGVDYNNRPGGMSTVIKYYKNNFHKLKYVATTYYTKKFALLVSIFVFSVAICRIFLILLFEKKIKIVHIHTAAGGSFVRASIVVKLSKLFKKNVILHCHASRFKEYYLQSGNKENIVKTLNLVNRLIVLSESWNSWFMEIGVNPAKIVILNNITNYPHLKEKKYGPKINLLYLGELGKRKGIFDILKAIYDNQNDLRKKIEFRFGGNTHEKEVEEKISEYGIGDFVSFEGWVSGQKVIDLFNWANVFILPSYNEGLPIGILEAMSYGCAIIASPVGGIPEVVKDGVNGIIVSPGDTIAIANAIRDFEDTAKLQRMSEISREMVKRYLPDSVMNELKTIYQSLL